MSAALVLAFTFASLFIYVGTSSFVLRDVFELSPTAYGFLFGANSVALIGGSQFSPWLSTRLSDRTLVSGSTLFALAAAAALLVLGGTGVGGLAGVAVPLWLMVLAVGVTMPMATTRAMGRHPERAGAASALLGVLQMGTGALVIPLVGLFGSTSVVPLGVALVVTLLIALGIHIGAARFAEPAPAAA
jgi:DHA1 family bicyclomycin/chloramphenicol resistance-like MFS transporter